MIAIDTVVICVDMKSFYSSCECVRLNLDPIKTKLAVVSNINRTSSVILAASPSLKEEYGIKTGHRYYDILKCNDQSILIVPPNMSYYLEMSRRISKIFETFVPPEAIHPYSIDESWLTLNGTGHIWGSPFETSRKIINRIYQETGLPSNVGIGNNKFLSKAALDLYGKQLGVFELNERNIKTHLHPQPLINMWGIGDKLNMRLNKLNLFTVGDLANANEEILLNHFGVIGIKLKGYANGIDESSNIIHPDHKKISSFNWSTNDIYHHTKSINKSVTLLTDYNETEDILLVIKDLIFYLTKRLRQNNTIAKTITVSARYSYKVHINPFSKQYTLNNYTDSANMFFETAKNIFYSKHYPGKPIRYLSITLSKLTPLSNDMLAVYSIKEKNIRNLQLTLDEINEKYGECTIYYGFFTKKRSVSRGLYSKLGGHDS